MDTENLQTKIKIMAAMIGLYILLPTALYILSKHVLFLTTYLSYVFIVIAFFFLITRVGKVQWVSSQKDTPGFPFRQWLGILMAGQAVLFLLFYSAVHTALSYVPAIPKESNFFLMLSRWGLYPWPLVAVMAVMLGYYVYCEKQPGLLTSALPTLRDRGEDVFVKRVVQMLLTVPLTFVLTLSIALGALQLTSLFSHLGGFAPSYELDFVNIILGMLFFILLSSKYYLKLINYFSAKEISIGSFLLGFMVVLSVLFTISNLIAVYLHIRPLKPIELPRLQWNLFLWTWWTGWSVLFASFVVRISNGRTVREMMLGLMLLPLALLLFFYFVPIPFRLLAHQHILLDLFALVGPFAIIFLLSRANNTSFLMFGFLPRTKSIIKMDKMNKFIPLFLQIVAFLSFAYLLFGMNFLAFLSVVAIYPGFILFLILTVFFIKRISDQKKHL